MGCVRERARGQSCLLIALASCFVYYLRLLVKFVMFAQKVGPAGVERIGIPSRCL
jgi:hypothetical protein